MVNKMKSYGKQARSEQNKNSKRVNRKMKRNNKREAWS